MAMTDFEPGQVMFGASGGRSPYIGSPAFLGPPQQKSATDPGQAMPPQGFLGAESIRASGTGPFDQAYRQNLATYAGGNFLRPGGSMSLNPTSQDPFGFGAPTGGGNAPVQGMPTSLLQSAMGGSPFSYAPPPVSQPAATDIMSGGDMQDWLQAFQDQGRAFRATNLM